MTITTKKSISDTVFFFNEGEMAINEGKVESVSSEIGSRMTPISTATPVTIIRYGIRTEKNFFQKEEKDVYESADAVLAKIKENSGLI